MNTFSVTREGVQFREFYEDGRGVVHVRVLVRMFVRVSGRVYQSVYVCA